MCGGERGACAREVCVGEREGDVCEAERERERERESAREREREREREKVRLIGQCEAGFHSISVFSVIASLVFPWRLVPYRYISNQSP